MKKVLLVVALLLLTACNSPPSGESRWMEAYGTNFPVAAPGRAALYIVRDIAYEGAPPINLNIGRRPVGGLTSLTWMRFDLQPRLYDVRAFGTAASSELIITVSPGQTRFLLVGPTGTSTEILEVSQLQGRRLVRQGQQLPATENVPEY
jgi:hypothetical protein